MKIKNIIPVLAIFSLVISCGGPGSKNQSSELESGVEQTTITRKQFDSNNFLLGKLEKRTFPTIVETSGTIDVPPKNKAVVSAITGGFVTKTPLLVGDQVKKGQVLVTLENQEFIKMQQEYLEVFNQLDFLKSEYQRNKTLFEEKIASEKKYLEAKSNYETHLAKYHGLKKQLQMLNISPSRVEQHIITNEAVIYAPINGSVTKINVATGSYVSSSDEILEIVDKDHIHLELTLFEKDVLKVEKGQKILFKIPEASNETYLAQVYLVGTSIHETQRTIKVHGHLEDENHRFLPGMFVDAKILTDTHEAFSIPDQAVLSSEGSSYLLKLVSENEEHLIFEKIKVMPGSSFEGFTEIKSAPNLNPEDKFLAKGVFDLFGN